MGADEKAFWKEQQVLARAAHEKAYPNYKYAPRATRNQKTDAGDVKSSHARQSNKLHYTPEQEVRSNLESQSTQPSASEPTISLQQAEKIEPHRLLEHIAGQMNHQVFEPVHLQMPEKPPQMNEGKLNHMLEDITGEVPAPAPKNMNEQMIHHTLDQVYDQKPEQTPLTDRYLQIMSQTSEGFDEHSDFGKFLDLDIDLLA